MTEDTFEVEFVAYNQFRELTGVPPVTRERFALTVERHNRALAAGGIAIITLAPQEGEEA